VNDVEFSRQGTRVVVADEDGNVRVWDRAITEPIAVLRGHDSTVFAATFAADGTTVASTGADGTVRLWDASTGQIVADGPSWINSAVFTRDDSRIVVGSADGTVRVFDRSGGRAVATLLVTDGAAPTRDERRRAKAAGTALYDGSAGTRPAMVNVAVPSPDGRWIFTGDGDGYVMRWDFANCRKMVVCDTYTGVPIGRGQLDTPATDLSVSPDSRLVAAAYAVGGGVQLFNSSGKLLATLSRAAIHGEAEAVRFIARRRLITASANGYAIVWDASGCRLRPCRPRRVRTLKQSEPIYTLAASPDGRRVVTGASDRVARVWNLANPKVKPLELRGHTGNVRAVAFDRSGTRVVTAGDDKSTRVWAVKTDSAQLLAVMEMHTNTVTGVSFDPRDPSRILSSSLDGSVRVYSCDTCRPLGDLRRVAEAQEHSVSRRAVLLRTDR
jgi:WD40 repeat protein